MPSDSTAANGAAADVTVSLAAQWREHIKQRQTRVDPPGLVTLPSGLTVKATRPHLLLLMQNGQIPDTLLPRVQAFMKRATGDEEAIQRDMADQLKADPAGFIQDWTRLMNIVWLAAVVEPRFTEHPDRDPDAIPIASVAEDDLTYLFIWAQGGSETIADYFRGKERATAALGARPDGGTVRPGPGGAGGPRPAA